MEEKLINKKRIAIFASVAIIISYIFTALSNVTISYLLADYTESMTSEFRQLFESCSGLAVNLLTLSAFLILGHILTKDKRKTFIFAGSMYFGKQAVAIISSLIIAILKILMYAGKLYSSNYAQGILITNIVFIPAIILVAYTFYTALEGINGKISGSLDTTELTLSRARKRYLCYALIGAVITGVITSAPSLVYVYMGHETSFFLSTLTTALTELTSWLGSVISLALLFLAGYKAYKSLTDGIAFGVCSGVAGGISGIFTGIMIIPLRLGINYLTTALQSDVNPTYMTLISVGMGAFSIIAAVVGFAVELIMLKYFFPSMKVALFSEQVYTPEAAHISAEHVAIREQELAAATVENDEAQAETEE